MLKLCYRFYMELMVNFDENNNVFDPVSSEQIVLWGGGAFSNWNI